MSLGALQSWLFFAAIIATALALHWQRPGERGGSVAVLALRGGVLAALLVGLVQCAQQAERGEALRIRVERLQVPLATVEPQVGTGQDSADPASSQSAYLIVGDQLSGSDLAIAPYGSDIERNREVLGDASRPLAVIHARRTGAGVDGWLCIHGYAPDRDLDLPGWHVVVDRGDDEPDDDLARAGADPGTAVETRCDIPLAAGDDPLRVRFFRSEYVDGAFKADAQERREVFVSRRGEGAEGSLSLQFSNKTALAASLGTCGDPVNRILPAVNGGDGIGYLPERNLVFPQLGSGGLHPLLDPVHLGRPIAVDAACAGHKAAFAWPQGPDGQAVLTGTVERHFLPWVSVFLILAGLLFYPAVRGRAWRAERAEGTVVLFIQALLVLRALFGIAGLPNYAAVSRTEVIHDLSVANAVLPALVIALMMRGGAQGRSTVAALALFAFGAFGATLLWVQSVEGWQNWGFVLGLAGMFLALRWRNADPRPLLVQAMAGLKAMPRHFSAWEWGSYVIILAVTMRLGLRGLGLLLDYVGIDDYPFSERVFGFALSIIYQPAMVIGFGCLAAGYLAAPRPSRLPWALFLFAVAMVATPAAVSDSGMIFVFGVPIALALAWLGLRRLGGQRHFGLAAPLLLLLAMVPAMMLAGRLEIASPTAPGGLAAHMEQASGYIRSNGNVMRILRFVAPEKVPAVGNKAALEVLDQAASMEPLGRSLLGRGFMEPSRVREPMVRYQYTDNLSSVHVMWPFGRLGAIGLLVLYGVFAAAMACRAGIEAPDGAGSDDSGPASPGASAAFVSLVAGTTLAWSALYMVAANLNLVPFAGKNLYLLAATSGADLLEGTAMVLLAGLAWLRAEDSGEARP